MAWIVTCLDRNTGKKQKVRYDVETELEAVRLAGKAGFAVERTKHIPDPPKVPDPPPKPALAKTPKPERSLSEDGRVVGPTCGSAQISVNKRGYSTGAGAAGCLLLGPVGLIFGAAGGNKVVITCLACGQEFSPGKRAGGS
jgi:hypothetical protein